MEMRKLLVARHVVPTLAVMTEAGLLDPVLGGVPQLASLSNLIKLEAALALPSDPVRRLGALAVQVIEDAERLRSRLRLANAEFERLRSMAEGWWQIWPAALDGHNPAATARALLYRIGTERFTDRVLLAWSRSPAGAADPAWHELATLPRVWHPPAFPLKAADFLARGMEPGPKLGAALRIAEEDWIGGGFSLDKAELATIAERAMRRAD
jgi:poly(A) polymerase